MVSLLLGFACALNFSDDASILDSGVLETPAATELPVVAPTPAPRDGCPMPGVADATAPIAPVAPVVVPIDPAKVDAWLATHGGVEYLGQHRMEHGETAWEMSQSIGVPVWVLRGLNPTQNLDRLHVGDWIEYPVTGNNEESASLWYTEEECGC